ncbi:acetate and sugar kinases/Hsc70/actin family protein [Spiroplasma taiwanense]|uniref:Gluconate kinase n=1 Tax=Spiroplasma taiwanense CT-1 TaxID=1276220 RepID=S5LXR5_9MOLU|nr:gluconate kinase [Spiroplasma taiwanense]AGR41386.1 gluconate kinase [Spiroplasma taiwanense CT-1]
MNTIYIYFGDMYIEYKIFDQNNNQLEYEKLSNAEIYFDNHNFASANKAIDWFNEKITKFTDKYQKGLRIIFTCSTMFLFLLDENLNQIGKGYTPHDALIPKINSQDLIAAKKINNILNITVFPSFKLKETPIKAYSFTTLKGYFAIKLINKNIIDIVDASSTGLLDFKTSKFSPKLLKYVNRENIICPEIYKKLEWYDIKLNNYDCKVNFGIPNTVLGLNVLKEKNVAILSANRTFGIRLLVDKPIQNLLEEQYCYETLDNKYVYGTVSSNGGNNIFIACSQLNISIKDIDNFDLSECTFIEEEINFFEKANFRKFSTKFLEFDFDLDLLYSVIIQFKNKLKFALEKMQKSLGTKIKIIASGAIFDSKYIQSVLINEFKEQITFRDKNQIFINDLKKFIT